MSADRQITAVQSVAVWLGLTETWLYTQVKHLPRNVTSHVVSEYREHLDQFPHEHLHCLRDRSRLRNFPDKLLRRIGVRDYLYYKYHLMKQLRADLIHSHFGNVGWGDTDAARRAGIPQIVTFYGLDVNFLPRHDTRWAGRYRKLFRQVDRVLCEGEHMGGSIVALGCPAEKVTVHHLGIDVDRIPFEPRTPPAGEPLRVLIAGTFREKKGIPDAIEALAMIREDIPLEVTIIGDGGENIPRSTEEKRRILDAIDRGGLRENTRLLGFRTHEELHEEARRAHVFLSPSVTASDGDTEGGAPVTIIEMAASGMAIVSTTHCDIPGVILDGETGLLAPERDPETLARHLRWLVENPGRWEAMQRAGRAHIEREFHAVHQGERLGEIYRAVLRGEEPGRAATV